MPNLSHLIVFANLSSTSGVASDIRVAETKRGISSRQWINRNFPNAVVDLGAEGEHWGLIQDTLRIEATDWDFSARFFKVFTAREVHYHIRTEYELGHVIAKALSFFDNQSYHDIETALAAYKNDLDVRIWMDSQSSRLITTPLYELLTQYYVLTSSKPLHWFNEYLMNPIFGEGSAIYFSSLLNRALADEVKDGGSPVIFAVRVGDLPAALNADDGQLLLIDWLADKELVPRGYTTIEKVEILSTNHEAAKSWIPRVRSLMD